MHMSVWMCLHNSLTNEPIQTDDRWNGFEPKMVLVAIMVFLAVDHDGRVNTV